MDLRQAAARVLTESILGQCAEEYRQMWHNATIRGTWPEITNNQEWKVFWDALNDAVHFLIQDLETEIKTRFNLNFKIYTWGRSGATIAPEGFSPPYFQHFNPALETFMLVNPKNYCDPEGDTAAGEYWIEALGMVRRHYAAFAYLNQQVRAAAKSNLKVWWEDYKIANDLTFEPEAMAM
jgi:hypothetical protein